MIWTRSAAAMGIAVLMFWPGIPPAAQEGTPLKKQRKTEDPASAVERSRQGNAFRQIAGRPPVVEFNEKNPPAARLDETEFDAGTVIRGAVVSHAFVVRNEGVSLLEIVNVSNACACTTSAFDRRIRPGQAGRVTLELDTKGFSGLVKKNSYIYTNDPAAPKIVLTMKADVNEVIVVEPQARLLFGLIPSGRAHEAVRTLRSTDGRPFRINRVDCDDPELDYRIEMDASGLQARVTVRLPEGRPAGTVKARLVFSPDHPDAPQVALPVFGPLTGYRRIEPREIDFGGVAMAYLKDAPPGAVSRLVSVLSDAEEGVGTVRAGSDAPYLGVAIQTLEEGRNYAVEVRLVPPVERGAFEAAVWIEVDGERVTIPVRGRLF